MIKEGTIIECKNKKFIVNDLFEAFGITVIDLLIKCGVKSKGEAKRLIKQNAVYIGDVSSKSYNDLTKIKDIFTKVIVPNDGILIKFGKKNQYKIII